MLEVMNTGYEAPVAASMTKLYDFSVPNLPTTTQILGIGKADNDDLIITAASGSPSIWVFRKGTTGNWEFYQQIQTTQTPNAGNPQSIPGGFIVATPTKPNNRGSIALYKRGSDGKYAVSPIMMSDGGGTNGMLGQYGGLAANTDWTFAAINFDGSFLTGFKRTTGDTFTFRDRIMKPGITLFASNCLRTIGEDTILCSSNNETAGATYSGAIYHVRIDNATNKLIEVSRMVPPAPVLNGYFGNSITVMDKNNAIATSRTGNETLFHHLRRPEGGAFERVSNITVKGLQVYTGSNAVASKNGRLLFCGNQGLLSNLGETMVIGFDPTTGVMTHLTNLAFKGTLAGQYMGNNQVVIGDEVIYVSSMKDAAPASLLTVFKYTEPR